MLKKLIYLWILLLSFFCNMHANGQAQKFAVMQFDSGNDSKIMVINGFKAAECEKLISTVFSGLKMDCPQCTKDYAGCSTELGVYQPVWENKKFLFPYVTSGNLRFIKTGEGRKELEIVCDVLAQKLVSNGATGVCIK